MEALSRTNIQEEEEQETTLHPLQHVLSLMVAMLAVLKFPLLIVSLNSQR